MTYRNDGSIISANIPSPANNYDIVDHGIYRAMVTGVSYTSDINNSSRIGLDLPKEVLYQVIIIGGGRDGQKFNQVSRMRTLGGIHNSEEITLKAQISPVLLDPANTANLQPTNKMNGDNVYIQFIGGSLRNPLIVGVAKHHANTDTEAFTLVLDGQKRKTTFNGVTTEIDRNGAYTWTKGLGVFGSAPNPLDILNPFVAEYIPIPGQEEAVKVSVDIKGTYSIDFLLGMSLTLNPLLDSMALGTAAGAAVNINGISDSVDISTLAGAAIAVSGIKDSIAISTLAGANLSINGILDSVNLSNSTGSALSVGIPAASLEHSGGAIVTLSPISAALTDATGAGFIAQGGFIKIGNEAAELLDVLDQFFDSMALAVYPGFGAPGSNVTDIVRLGLLIKAIKGV